MIQIVIIIENYFPKMKITNQIIICLKCIDIFHEHDISIPVQVGEAVPMGACGVDQSPITGSNSGW